MNDADRLIKEALNGQPLLEVFPMDGKSTECPRCGLKFKDLLHPFCEHEYCPPREFEKKADPHAP